jgi:hypothetical protein
MTLMLLVILISSLGLRVIATSWATICANIGVGEGGKCTRRRGQAPPQSPVAGRDSTRANGAERASDAARGPRASAAHPVVDNSARTLACEPDQEVQFNKGRRCTESSVG